MNKIILVMLILLPFEMIHAVEEGYLEEYWISDDSLRAWSKKEGGIPVKEGDYIKAEADYALRYCNDEPTLHMNISRRDGQKTFEDVIYICRYNGKPIKIIETIFGP